MSHNGRRTEPGTDADSPMSKNFFVKSSALAPTSLNWMGMYLVKEHMNAHYRRLYNAKATVNTNRLQVGGGNSGAAGQTAKSTRPSSQNAGVSKSANVSRVPSRSSSRVGRTGGSREVMSEDRPQQRRTTNDLMDKLDRYFQSVQRDKPHQPIPKTESRSSLHRPHSSSSYLSQKSRSSSPVKPQLQQRNNLSSPDLLDRHKDKFTNPAEPFVPRTLIRDSQCRINPAADNRNNRSRLSSTVVDGRERNHQNTHENSDHGCSRPVIVPARRCNSQSSIPQASSEYEETGIRPHTSRQIALASGKTERLVPALNIKRDTDHVRWLEEQARKVWAEQKLEPFDDRNIDENCYGSEFDNDDEGYSVEDYPKERRKGRSHIDCSESGHQRKSVAGDCDCCCRHHRHNHHRHRYHHRSSSSHNSMWVRKQLEAEEEELKCLEFINDVTNDILIRGIYTDKALKQVFQYHMGRRSDLNRNKIKIMLDKLQEDLGIESSRRKSNYSDFQISYNDRSRKSYPPSSSKVGSTNYGAGIVRRDSLFLHSVASTSSSSSTSPQRNNNSSWTEITGVREIPSSPGLGDVVASSLHQHRSILRRCCSDIKVSTIAGTANENYNDDNEMTVNGDGEEVVNDLYFGKGCGHGTIPKVSLNRTKHIVQANIVEHASPASNSQCPMTMTTTTVNDDVATSLTISDNDAYDVDKYEKYVADADNYESLDNDDHDADNAIAVNESCSQFEMDPFPDSIGTSLSSLNSACRSVVDDLAEDWE